MNTAFNTIVGRTLQNHVKHIRLSFCDLNSANPIATANRTLETAQRSIDISLAQRQTENQYCKLIQIPASQSAVTDAKRPACTIPIAVLRNSTRRCSS